MGKCKERIKIIRLLAKFNKIEIYQMLDRGEKIKCCFYPLTKNFKKLFLPKNGVIKGKIQIKDIKTIRKTQLLRIVLAIWKGFLFLYPKQKFLIANFITAYKSYCVNYNCFLNIQLKFFNFNYLYVLHSNLHSNI